MINDKDNTRTAPLAEDPSALVGGVAGAVVAVATEGLIARTPLARAAALVGATVGAVVGYELGHSELGRDLAHAFDDREADAMIPVALPQHHPNSNMLQAHEPTALTPPTSDPAGGLLANELVPAAQLDQSIGPYSVLHDLNTVLAMQAINQLSHRGDTVCDPTGSIDPVAEIGGRDSDALSGDIV
jgi:hypothetical protein